MSRGKRHSQAEIAAKLVEADDLASQGKSQSDIANTLGVSVMTLHRWRKPAAPHRPLSIMANETEMANENEKFKQELGQGQQVSELQYENSRLRRIGRHIFFAKQ